MSHGTDVVDPALSSVSPIASVKIVEARYRENPFQKVKLQSVKPDANIAWIRESDYNNYRSKGGNRIGRPALFRFLPVVRAHAAQGGIPYVQRDLRQQFQIRVNGEDIEVSCGDKRLLMDVLRDDLRLIGTKNGCTQGYCGSCRVILNGKAVNSCTTPMRVADGGDVVTIEGIGTPESPHPLQTAFAEHGACQCGFCIPGFIVSAYGLLEKNPDPSVEEIKTSLEDNVCRCTGYRQILEAIDSVIHPEAGSPVERGSNGKGAVGRSFLRDDALEKCCGTALYADDLFVDDMLYAAVLRSAHPHARILSIDRNEAAAMEGVHAVLTDKDVPHNRFGLLTPDQPVLAEGKVRCAGEAVAAVAAETPDIAEAALKAIKVEWEVLPAVLDPRDALEEDAPYIQDLIPEGQVIKDYGKNIVSRRQVDRGDVDAAFEECAVVVEREFAHALCRARLS